MWNRVLNHHCLLLTDALHAYFGVCGLSLMNEGGLQTMCAALSVSQRAADKLAEIHNSWNSLRLCPQPDFFHDKHVLFFQTCITKLPQRSTTEDVSKYVTALHFVCFIAVRAGAAS